jgi:hypothetical protein
MIIFPFHPTLYKLNVFTAIILWYSNNVIIFHSYNWVGYTLAFHLGASSFVPGDFGWDRWLSKCHLWEHFSEFSLLLIIFPPLLTKMRDSPDRPHPQSLLWGFVSPPELRSLHSKKVKFVIAQSRLSWR